VLAYCRFEVLLGHKETGYALHCPITVEPIAPSALPTYSAIPIAFRVHRALEVVPREGGLGGLILREASVHAPYTVDFDARGDGPESWPEHFDVSHWGLFLARSEGRAIGAAAIAVRTPGLRMLEERSDLAVLWDIRVAPGHRRSGVGRTLWDHAVCWSRKAGCRTLKAKSQNINVAACHFCARHGCQLGSIHRYAYPDHPEEAILLWYFDLGR